MKTWRSSYSSSMASPEVPRSPDRDLHDSRGLSRFAIGRERLMLAGVLVVTALACLRCLGNNFVLDDEFYIGTNQYIGQWSFAWKALYRDATWFRNPQFPHVSVYYRPLWLEWYWLNYRQEYT